MGGGSSKVESGGRFRVSVACASTLTLLCLGAVAFRVIERWGWVDCVYAACGVLTCVGIVVTPRTAGGRALVAVLNVSSLGVTGLWLSEVADARRSWTRRALRMGSPAPGDAAAWGRGSGDALALAAAALPPWFTAGAFFAWSEGWPLPEALYFALTCATGLGMGGDNLEPLRPLTRVVFCAYIVAMQGVTFHLCAAVGAVVHAAVARLLRSTEGGGPRPHTETASE